MKFRASLKKLSNTAAVVTFAGALVLTHSVTAAPRAGGDLGQVPESAPVAELRTLPLHIINVLDEQGRSGYYDIQTPVTFEVAARLVRDANQWTLSAGIRMTLDKDDFETIQDDYLNLDSSPPSASLNLGDQNARPPQTGVREHLDAFQKLADRYPQRLTVILHRGSEWKWDTNTRRWIVDLGASHGGPGMKHDPKRGYFIRLVGARPGVLAHEVGHALGLNHTFRDDVIKNPNTDFSAQLSQFCMNWLDKGGDLQHPELAFDGDYERGVSDTPPDPGPVFGRASKSKSGYVVVPLQNRAPLRIFMSHDNIMGWNQSTQPFTSDQGRVMRTTLDQWTGQ